MGVEPELAGFEETSTTGHRGRAAEIFAALRGLRPLARPWLRVRHSFPLEPGGETTRIAAFVTTRRRLRAFRQDAERIIRE